MYEFSTAASLTAFDRFMARREVSSEIFSDCGIDFLGADKNLKIFEQPSRSIRITCGPSDQQIEFQLPWRSPFRQELGSSGSFGKTSVGPGCRQSYIILRGVHNSFHARQIST